MRPYLDLMRRVLDSGTPKEDRTGTGTLSRFGEQLRFDLSGARKDATLLAAGKTIQDI